MTDCRLSTTDYRLPTTDYRLPLHREVARVRVVNHQSRDRGLRIHHEALGQLDADLLSW